MNPVSHVPRAVGDLHAAVAARVLEGGDAAVLGAHHDDRLVEDRVLDVVVRPGDLLEPARHLPGPRPQLIGLELEEVGVVVALLAAPVGQLHRVRHRQHRPLVVHDRHATPLASRRSRRELILTGRYKIDLGVREDASPTPRHPPPKWPHDNVLRTSHRRLAPTRPRRRRARRRGRHHRHLPALPGTRGRLLGAARRGRQRRRRHVVLEPVSGRPVRLRELHVRLPVLARAVRRVGVAGALRRAARDRALPQPRGRPVRPAPPHPLRLSGHGRRVRRAVGHVGRDARRRRR